MRVALAHIHLLKRRGIFLEGVVNSGKVVQMNWLKRGVYSGRERYTVAEKGVYSGREG